MTQTTKKHTAAFRIFHYYYRCYIPQSQLYSREFLQQFGVPTTGDKKIDREMANSSTLAQLTIAQIANHFDDGATITLEDPRKSVEIYETIREHLVLCRETAQNPAGGEVPPMEDLRKLDNLAGEVYKIARGYMSQATEDSRLFSRLNQLGGRRAMTRDTKVPEARQVAAEHTPVTDAINKANFQRTKQWR